MVILDLRSLDLDDSIDLLAVTWEVSDDPSFQNVLLESKEDYKNKTSIIFSENLDPDMKYYARARALTSAGWTSWGNVDVFKVRNNTDLSPQDIFPTKVSIPRIRTFRMVTDTGLGYLNPEDVYANTNSSTDTTNKSRTTNIRNSRTTINTDKPEWDNDAIVESLLHQIDPANHDLTLFEIWVDGFEVIGNASLKATSYWIEDTDGNVIWKNLVDRTNRNKIKIQDLILKANKTYRIRAVFHTDSNDVSQISTYTITTKGCDEINLVSYLDQVPYNKELDLQIEWFPGIKYVKWEILQYSLGIIKSIWKTETTTVLATVPDNILDVNNNYLLRIKTNLSDTYKYYPFITTVTGDESPNDPLTPLLVYPTTVTVGINNQARILVESIAKDITYIANSDYYVFDNKSHFVTGTKVGEDKLYIKAKIDHYRENIIEVKINVVAEDTGGNNDGSNKFVKVKPDIVNVEVAEESISTISTNCSRVIAQCESDTVRVTLDDKIVRILGLKDGDYQILVIGYDINNNSVASATITGTVTDTGATPPEEPDPEPEEYFLNLEPENLELKAGETKLVKVNTNAPYWDPRNIDGDFFKYKKMSSSDLRIIAESTGTGLIVIYGSNKEEDVIEKTLNIKSIYNVSNTEFVFDETEYECKVLNEIEIPFTSNITSVEEYDITIEDERIELIRKLETSFIVKPKYEAANETFTIIVQAKKNSSNTHEYTETTSIVKVVVPDLVYQTDEVIVYPNEPATEYFYKGGIYSEYVYYPPNPISFMIYVHKEAIENKINIISNPFEDGVGSVVSKKLGEEITTDGDKFKELKPLEFMIKTGNTDDYGNPENSNIFTVKPVVEIRGVPYERSITLKPIAQTQLGISTSELTIDKFSSNNDIIISTNATDYTITSSNTNVAIVEKGELQNGVSRINIITGIDGTATLTVEATNESGVKVIDTCDIKVGKADSDGILARPLPGQKGFGVGTAPLHLSNLYGLTPVDKENVNNPEHHYFGNYQDSNGNIMCFIPKMYFRCNIDSETIKQYKDKLQPSVKGKNRYILEVSYENKSGYTLHRSFINNGKEIEGIFVDKYLSSYSGSTPEESSIPRSKKDGIISRSFLNKQVTYNNNKVTINKQKDKQYWLLIPKNRHQNATWEDRFSVLLLDLISVASYHAAVINDKADSHPFYNMIAKRPLGAIPDNSTNTTYLNKRPSGVSVGSNIDSIKSSPLEPDNDNMKYFTHNGDLSGVVYSNSCLNQFQLGIVQLPNQTQQNVNGKWTYYLHGYKLNFDRSNISPDNYDDKGIYDTYLIPMTKENGVPELFHLGTAGTDDNTSSLFDSATTDINSDEYLLTSLGLPMYVEDYYDDFTSGWIPKITTDKIDKLRGDLLMVSDYKLDKTYVNVALTGPTASKNDDGFYGSSNNWIDMYYNDSSNLNGVWEYYHRVIIVPNVGKALDIKDKTEPIKLIKNAPIDWEEIRPCNGGNIEGTFNRILNTTTVKVQYGNEAYVEYDLREDIKKINSLYPRHKFPDDLSKVSILTFSTDGSDYGTFTIDKSSYKLVFSPGLDYTRSSSSSSREIEPIKDVSSKVVELSIKYQIDLDGKVVSTNSTTFSFTLMG